MASSQQLHTRLALHSRTCMAGDSKWSSNTPAHRSRRRILIEIPVLSRPDSAYKHTTSGWVQCRQQSSNGGVRLSPTCLSVGLPFTTSSTTSPLVSPVLPCKRKMMPTPGRRRGLTVSPHVDQPQLVPMHGAQGSEAEVRRSKQRKGKRAVKHTQGAGKILERPASWDGGALGLRPAVLSLSRPLSLPGRGVSGARGRSALPSASGAARCEAHGS